jgi:hypothetical protein
MIEARLVKHEMHVARSVRVTFEEFEKFANGSIMWDGIWYRDDSVEPEVTLIVALHNYTSIWFLTVCVLYVIETFAVCFPDVHFCTCDRLAGGILDCADDETRFTIWIMR